MSQALVTVATCNLDQWSLDFDGNLARIKASIHVAKRAGAKYRLGPELEVCGYGCEDHFLEIDTFMHCWESLATLLSDDTTDGILCDIGMPVLHRGVRYNCRVFCLDRRILLIRPKLFLADDGNYRESRWFTPWSMDFTAPKALEAFTLPPAISMLTGQADTVFGIAVLAAADASVSAETCEELFTPLSPNIALALDGVDIIGNGSGSHHQLRKLHTRVDLMRGATTRGGGVYLYSNQQGCDGGRLYYDGCALVLVNGECVGQGDQFSLRDVEVVTATVDLNDVRSMRAATASRNMQASAQPPLPRVAVPMAMVTAPHGSLKPATGAAAGELGCGGVLALAGTVVGGTGALAAAGVVPDAGARGPVETFAGHDSAAAADAEAKAAAEWQRLLADVKLTPPGGARRYAPSRARPVKYLTAEEEIALGPACWLWDFLRRSGASGYFLPLSGGADSAATCAIVGVMCTLVYREVAAGNASVLADLRRIVRQGPRYTPTSPQEVASRILHTTYMGTTNSTEETKERAASVAAQVGAYHLHAVIDAMVAAVVTVFVTLVGATLAPRFKAHGGSHTQDLALQNVQARLRMVLAYFLAQLLPWARACLDGKPASPAASGYLLVLGSANVDEALRGYMTKYDCSSADINPIGAIAKGDLKRFLLYAADAYGYPALADVVAAPPTAELQPVVVDPSTGKPVMQLDEVDMGMSYEELGWFGRLRKNARCGPVTMYAKLRSEWEHLPARAVAEKVKRFFVFYSRNRHKMTTLTPSYHAESYSPDDNRYDLRPFLYNTAWERQFAAIDADVTAVEAAEAAEKAGAGGGSAGAAAAGGSAAGATGSAAVAAAPPSAAPAVAGAELRDGGAGSGLAPGMKPD